MKWPKDRKKAFLWAAEAFGTPYNERTGRQKELTICGICFTIKELTESTGMYFWAERFFGVNVSWWPERSDFDWTPACDDERSLFCCLMATLSAKEFKEISG